MLEKLKIRYQAYNFFNKKYLKHNISLYNKYGLNKKYYSSISSQDFKNLEEESNVYDIENSNPLLKDDPTFLALNKNRQEEILNWSDRGYSILKGFFSEKEVDAINLEIETLEKKGKIKPNIYKKYMFANRVSKLINDIGNGKMKQVLEVLLKREITLFQTINFINGSQQRTHSDAVHMTTFPKGNLIATWVALQDVTIDDGLLHYYPGSHKLPYIMNEDYDNIGTKYKLGNKNYTVYEDKIEEIIQKNNLEKKEFLAKKGDVLIWHANLLHGGNKVNKIENTRKSMVFHYLAKNVICYHEITQRPTLKEKFKK